jgi:P21-Rho-binding domain
MALKLILADSKEPEMQIGYPTDVKHVAHIGWDNQASNNGPSWVNLFIYSNYFNEGKTQHEFVEDLKINLSYGSVISSTFFQHSIKIEHNYCL